MRSRFSKEFSLNTRSRAKQALSLDGGYSERMRLGSDDEQAPAPPSAPTYGSTIKDYVENYPQIFDLMQKYGPQEAALQKSINEQLYPGTAGLQEQLAGVASKGIGEGAPDWYKNQMSDALKSQFGSNVVFNPLGQQAYGQQYMQGLQDWGRYYENLGLSLAGRQPLATYSNNITSQYTPSQATQFAANQYGTQANIYGTQSSNWQNAPSNPWMNMAGSLAGGIGQGIGSGMGFGMMSGFMPKTGNK